MANSIYSTNWTKLFGSPQDAECKDCNSIYSPAAYLVDIMQYLDHCNSKDPNKSALQVMLDRRPDIGNLLLTCENTNTEIPYIDLANEIMEYYLVHFDASQHQLPPTNPPDSDLKHDTGKATADELKAEPQYILLDAYQKIYTKGVYPFTLPYNQPLDVIRTYLKFLKTSRAELLEVFNVTDNAGKTTIPLAAIDAEYLLLSLNEYAILTATDFFGHPYVLQSKVEAYYGNPSPTYVKSGIPVTDFLQRTGLQYTDLLTILETRFINPGQDALNVLQILISQANIDSQTLYAALKSNPSQTPAVLLGVLKTNKIAPADFANWLTNTNAFSNFQSVITLYESNSDSNIDKTFLHSIACIYDTPLSATIVEPVTDNNVTDAFLSRFHRFVRLWRKTGWTVHGLDNMISALGETDITPSLIHKLAVMGKVNAALDLPLVNLACLWGNIDTYGDNSADVPEVSLYAQLFLKNTGKTTSTSNTNQQPDIFTPNLLNQIFNGSSTNLNDPKVMPAIYAALALSADEYSSILNDANLNGGFVTLANLSVIFRYKLLADQLNLSVVDLCTLKSPSGFNINPFLDPDATLTFIQQVQKLQASGFSVSLFSYVLSGIPSPGENIALSQETILQAIPPMRARLETIDADNPSTDLNNVTPSLLAQKLMLIYSKEVADQFVLMLESAVPQTMSVVVPDQTFSILDATKYAYAVAVSITAPVGGAFSPNETITDGNGSSAVVVFVSTGTGSMLTLSALKLAAGQKAINGIITGSTSGVKATVNTLYLLLTGYMSDADMASITSSAGTSPAFQSAIVPLYQESVSSLQGQCQITAPQSFTAVPNPNPIPPTLSPKYSFVQIGKALYLQCSGIMSDADYAAFKGQNLLSTVLAAIDYIYSYPRSFTGKNFAGLYDTASTAFNLAMQQLFGLSGSPVFGLAAKLNCFYTTFLPFLIGQLKSNQILSALSVISGLDVPSLRTIIAKKIPSLIEKLSTFGLSASYFGNEKLSGSAVTMANSVDPTIDFSWGAGSPDPLKLQSDNFSARWNGWICPPVDDDYTFTIRLTEIHESATLWIDGVRVLSLNQSAYIDSIAGASGQATVTMSGGILHSLVLEYIETIGDAGIHLLWQSATMLQTIIDPAVLFPDNAVQSLLAEIPTYHRAAQLINGLKLSATEVGYLVNNQTDSAKIDFLPVLVSQWSRLVDYTALRQTIPAKSLLSIFGQASIESNVNPAATPSDSLVALIAASATPSWNKGQLAYLIGRTADKSGTGGSNSYYGYTVTNFRNEIALLQIKRSLDLAIKTKMQISPSGLPSWAATTKQPSKKTVKQPHPADADFTILSPIAEQIKQAVKSKYSSNWFTIATQLNTPIRQNQNQALIAYLLTLNLPAPDGTGVVTDGDGLYEFLLIDVQMAPIVVSSRLIQATMAVQLFADRCLMGLESNVPSGLIHPDEWAWMKVYSVAAGLKKLFVNVENYLDPSLRDDKSPFFLDFESALKKGDITEQNVENAFRDYLYKLDEVSNMELCGMFHDLKTNILHVFARTHAAPYNYYYRTATNSSAQLDSWKWAAWEQVQLDIKCIDDKDNSGVHLMPVIWKNRLVLFWPEFTEKTTSTITKQPTFQQMANLDPSFTQSQKYWEIRFAWSEYANGKWTPKKLSKEVFPALLTDWEGWFALDNDARLASYLGLFENGQTPTIQELASADLAHILAHIPCSGFSFGISINSDQEFEAVIRIGSSELQQDVNLPENAIPLFIGKVRLSDVTNKLEIISSEPQSQYENAIYNSTSSEYTNDTNFSSLQPFFQSYRVNNKKLSIANTIFLKNPKSFKLLFSDDAVLSAFEATLRYPFFYSDTVGRRTYFATPIPITSVPQGSRNYAGNLIADTLRNKTNAPLSFIDPNSIIVAPPPVGAGSFQNPPLPTLPALENPDFAPINPNPGVSNQLSTNVAYVVPGSQPPPAFNGLGNSSRAETNIAQLLGKGTAQYSQNLNLDAGSFASGESARKIVPLANTGLAFYTFYHPFTGVLLKKLNQGGLSALLAADTAEFKEDPNWPYIDDKHNLSSSIANDSGTLFTSIYNPDFQYVQQYDPSDPQRNYYLRNVDFSDFGTYSCYNWEIFFHAPFLICRMLSKNGKYAEALNWFHNIFCPISKETPDPKNENSPFWRVLPFKKALRDDIVSFIESLPQGYDNNDQVDAWRNDPFNAFLIARNRPIAFMKNVVMCYCDNLIAWGDDLYRTYTRENINQAIQKYVMVAHLLKASPQFIPQRGVIQHYSYNSLKALQKDGLNDLGDANVPLENIFPNSSEVQQVGQTVPQNLLGIGKVPYFCIPPNEKLLQYWTTISDRLFKIRHGENIDGVVVPLALYEPPIDPELLLQAKAQGMDISSIIANLEGPVPLYRFTYLLQKTKELCNEVIALRNSSLSVDEKCSAEQLARLRQTQEIDLLGKITNVKARQVLEAQANLEALLSNRATAVQELTYYAQNLLGNQAPTVPDLNPLPDNLDETSSLPPETIIAGTTSPIDVSLADTDVSGVKIIPKEKQGMDYSNLAYDAQQIATSHDVLSSILYMFPSIAAHETPLGIGASETFGGVNLGSATTAMGRVFQMLSTAFSHTASQATTIAGFIRREQEWVHLANRQTRAIVELDKQITTAQIRHQLAKYELANHGQQKQNAQEIEDFLKAKFTNQELYQWMLDRLQETHKQGYNLVYDRALMLDKAFRFELGLEKSNFIQYGYYNDAFQGATAAEQLLLALNQMEAAYLQNNVREFELTKNISLLQVDPLALLQLRETGSCVIDLPEDLFDLDYPGHYFRRIKSISLTIPCVTGPYTTINCTLRLLKNSIRINTVIDKLYPHNADKNGVFVEDDRFVENNIPCTAIATSSAQNDSGLFELSFRDERYLPFEGAGAISTLRLELNGKYQNSEDGLVTDLSQFNTDTISDVIITCRMTSRENAGDFKQAAINNLKKFVAAGPFTRMFSLRHEFPTEWYSFFNAPAQNGDQTFNLQIDLTRLPYLVSKSNPKITSISIYADTGQMPTLQITPPNNPTKTTAFEFGSDPTVGTLQVSNPDNQKLGNNNLGVWKFVKPGNLALTTNDVKDIFILVNYATE